MYNLIILYTIHSVSLQIFILYCRGIEIDGSTVGVANIDGMCQYDRSVGFTQINCKITVREIRGLGQYKFITYTGYWFFNKLCWWNSSSRTRPYLQYGT